jgi:hypothetical protein
MSQLHSKILLEGDQLFIEYKGALTENYIAQSLTTFLEHQRDLPASPCDNYPLN